MPNIVVLLMCCRMGPVHFSHVKKIGRKKSRPIWPEKTKCRISCLFMPLLCLFTPKQWSGCVFHPFYLVKYTLHWVNFFYFIFCWYVLLLFWVYFFVLFFYNLSLWWSCVITPSLFVEITFSQQHTTSSPQTNVWLLFLVNNIIIRLYF